MGAINGFWSADCPERGPALSHAHWRDCDPLTGHPVTGDLHSYSQCCHCEHTAETWEREQEFQMREAAVPPDDRPLALPQGEACIFDSHTATIQTPKIGDDGLEWQVCPSCHQQKEPALATGHPIGPLWGIGRGWISPRMKRRWTFIAERTKGQH